MSLSEHEYNQVSLGPLKIALDFLLSVRLMGSFITVFNGCRVSPWSQAVNMAKNGDQSTHTCVTGSSFCPGLDLLHTK